MGVSRGGCALGRWLVDGYVGLQQDREAGQVSLFGEAAPRPRKTGLPEVPPWTEAERLAREKEVLGFFISGHPLDDYAGALKRMNVQSWADFSRSVKNGVNAGRTAATVVSRTERRTKTGNKMGIIGLSDPSGQYEAILFAEGLMQYREVLEPGSAVLLFLSAEAQGDDVRARIQSAERLDQAAEKVQKGLRIFLRDPAPLEGITKRLEATKAATGRSTQSAPKTSGNASINYDVPTPIGDFVSAAAATYSGAWFADMSNTFREPAHTLINVSETWNTLDGKSSVSVWCKNCGDKYYDVGLNLLTPVGAVGNPGAPRTFGVTFHRAF